MSSWWKIALALSIAAPAVVVRLSGAHLAAPVAIAVFGAAVVASAFLLVWAAEAARHDISGNLATAILAVIAVLPEYAVDCTSPGARDTFPRTPVRRREHDRSNRLLLGLAGRSSRCCSPGDCAGGRTARGFACTKEADRAGLPGRRERVLPGDSTHAAAGLVRRGRPAPAVSCVSVAAAQESVQNRTWSASRGNRRPSAAGAARHRRRALCRGGARHPAGGRTVRGRAVEAAGSSASTSSCSSSGSRPLPRSLRSFSSPPCSPARPRRFRPGHAPLLEGEPVDAAGREPAARVSRRRRPGRRDRARRAPDGGVHPHSAQTVLGSPFSSTSGWRFGSPLPC